MMPAAADSPQGRRPAARPSDPRRNGGTTDLGRDGITGMVSRDRAVRAREVSRPDPVSASAEDAGVRDEAADVLADLAARVAGRR